MNVTVDNLQQSDMKQQHKKQKGMAKQEQKQDYKQGNKQEYKQGNKQEYKQGNKQEYKQGSNSVKKDGYKQGSSSEKKDGYKQGSSSVKKDGYKQGSNFVKKDGYKQGSNFVKKEGYKQGYKQGSNSVHKESVSKQRQSVKGKGGKKESGEQLPTIEAMLRVAKEERGNAARENLEKVKPFFSSFMVKKQGSRVVHLLFKWGSQEVKNQIFQSIMVSWKEFIKSSYALYTIAKVCNEFEFPRLSEDAGVLQNNPEGAMVLENFLLRHPESQKAKQVLGKFTGIRDQLESKGLDSQEILHNLALKSIEKDYYGLRVSKLILRLAFPTLVDSERQKCVDFLSDKIVHLLGDEEGLRLFIVVFGHLDSKQKKLLVKGLHNDTEQPDNCPIRKLLLHNNFSYVALIKIITEVDDTVLLGKKLIPELLDLLPHMGQFPKLINLFASLLSSRTHNFNCLGKYEKQVSFTTCKKPEEQRLAEVRTYFFQPLVQHLLHQDQIEKTCRDPARSRLALGLIKALDEDGIATQLKSICSALCKHFLADLNCRKESEKSKQVSQLEESLVANNFGSKLIKNILLLNQPFIDKYCDKFADIFTSNMPAVLKSKATFALSGIIERGGRDWLLKEVRNAGVDLTAVLGGHFYKDRI